MATYGAAVYGQALFGGQSYNGEGATGGGSGVGTGAPAVFGQATFGVTLFGDYSTGTVVEPTTSTSGGWGSLLSVLEEARAAVRYDRARVLVDCPVDGEPLVASSGRGRVCPFCGRSW